MSKNYKKPSRENMEAMFMATKILLRQDSHNDGFKMLASIRENIFMSVLVVGYVVALQTEDCQVIALDEDRKSVDEISGMHPADLLIELGETWKTLPDYEEQWEKSVAFLRNEFEQAKLEVAVEDMEAKDDFTIEDLFGKED